MASLERTTGSGVQAEGSGGYAAAALEALTCALIPGPCVARAAATAYAEAEATAASTRAELERRAAEATTAAAGGARSLFSGLGDTIVEGIEASAEPIAETASATRYVAVAVTITIVALVVLAIFVALKVT